VKIICDGKSPSPRISNRVGYIDYILDFKFMVSVA